MLLSINVIISNNKTTNNYSFKMGTFSSDIEKIMSLTAVSSYDRGFLIQISNAHFEKWEMFSSFLATPSVIVMGIFGQSSKRKQVIIAKK